METNRIKQAVAAGALVLAGLGSGAVIFSTGAATAAGTDTTTSSGSSSSSSTAPKGHAGETPLSGTTAAKVKAAALAKYPGATIVRLETDSDGVYEAHITTKAGDAVIVQVGSDFSVTGTQQGGGPGGPGGPGGSNAPAAPSSSATS